MQDPQSTVTPSSDVIFTELQNGEGVLLHVGTKTYFTLNVTGVEIWRMLNEGMTLAAIGQALEHKYEVDLESAQRSVASLVDELVAAELLSRPAD